MAKVVAPVTRVAEVKIDKTDFWFGTGRRKSSVARVRMTLGGKDLLVNDKPIAEYFPGVQSKISFEAPLKAVGRLDTISATINPTQGGGGGVVIDEVDSPYGNQSWYDSQIEVEADGTVLASTWGHNGGYVGALNLGKANFGADNTVSFDYNDATGLFSANLNGTLSSMNYGAGARYTPVAYGSSQFYGFGNGDITNLGNGQSFVGTIADVTIGSGAAAVPEPAIWAMMLVGMGLIGFAARRRQNVSLTYA